MDDIYVIIPTLNPDEKIMRSFIKELKEEFKNILVVNDGSNSTYKNFFKSLENDNIIIINHYCNLGKGRAIKTALNYILNNCQHVSGVVTCDCDGQHSVQDVKKCALQIKKDNDYLVLGVRDFDLTNVPLKSRWGNKITHALFKTFIGLDISDNQTGLRGFNIHLMQMFLGLSGERYEYETNMLIYCKNANIPIKEVSIETIYLNNNANSHFNPLKDAILIYKLFMKYFLASFSSFIIDITLFCCLFGVLQINNNILAATILARIVSSIYNYIVNSNLVFKKMSLYTLLKYYLLAVIQMFISGCFVTYLASLLPRFSVVLIKMFVDSILWVVNLVVQRDYVFKGDYHE